MSAATLKWIPSCLLIGFAANAIAQDTAKPGVAPAENRLRISTNGSTLTGTDGQFGGAVGWLRNAGPTVFSLGAEHQFVEDSRWTFGSMTAAYNGGQGSSRWSLYGEAHQGRGESDGRDFDYSVFAVGVIRSLTNRLSVQLDDRQIDIDTADGNLPKLGLTYLFSPRLIGAVAYSHSISGNLDTDLVSARFDYYGKSMNFMVGGAGGNAAGAVFNLATGLTETGVPMKEGFFGIGKNIGRTDWMLIGDYLEMSESERITLTLSCTIRLGQLK